MVAFQLLNLGFVDLWTLIHAAAGFMLAFLFLRPGKGNNVLFFWMIGLALLGWEVLEVAQGRGGFGGSESGINIITDIIAGLIGAAIGYLALRNSR